jgi:transposase
MKKQGRYSNEFKQEVLRMAASSSKSISELERDLGLSAGLIRKWQQRYREGRDEGKLLPSQESEAQAEIRRLKRENDILRQERDILKKALKVFSRDQE